MLTTRWLPTTDIYEVCSNQPSKEDRLYIQDILQQILAETLNDKL
jgi:hypothetical protein